MTEKIVELIYNEINVTRVMTKLKLSNLSTAPSAKVKNARLRQYNHTYETCTKSVAWLANEYEGKELRKELHKWAIVLYKDAMRILRPGRRQTLDEQSGMAVLHFSKSIIEAFKKLPR